MKHLLAETAGGGIIPQVEVKQETKKKQEHSGE